MREEAEEKAKAILDRAARGPAPWLASSPRSSFARRQRSDEILKLIEEDRDIALLVLAAGPDAEGPGPLVSTLVGKAAGTFPIPIAVIPGTLDDEAIDALA